MLLNLIYAHHVCTACDWMAYTMPACWDVPVGFELRHVPGNQGSGTKPEVGTAAYLHGHHVAHRARIDPRGRWSQATADQLGEAVLESTSVSCGQRSQESAVLRTVVAHFTPVATYKTRSLHVVVLMYCACADIFQ